MIKQIKVKNFKCFEEMSVECRELNLFTGVNGMGKSTMIQVLLLFRQTFERNQLGRDNHMFLNGRYVSLGKIKDISYWYKKDEDISLLVEEEGEESWECRYSEEEQALLAKGYVLSSGGAGLAGKGFEYISAERLGPRRYYDDLGEERYAPTQIGSKGEYAVSSLYALGSESDFKVYENMKNPGESSERLELQVNAWMSEISPGIRVKAIPNLDSDVMGLRYSQPSIMGEESTNAINMGFGVSYVLPVIIALLKARKGDLLILENPEAHIHPKGQRQIGELIARAAANGVQIIMETHSDHILNGIRISVKHGQIQPEQVKLNYFYIYNDDGMIKHDMTSPEILSDGSLSNWPDGFFDEWDKAVDSLF
ncbi:MAG: DUF3696 domain-containing protein [Lachnospiraceae bacterium]|nr:DUF3696 domain-containing protein [Lachnospiraceae bacterium]